MDNDTAERLHEGLRTALAMALAQARNDGDALVALWGGVEDVGPVVQGLSALPSIALDMMAGHLGVEVDVEQWYQDSLMAMSARGN